MKGYIVMHGIRQEGLMDDPPHTVYLSREDADKAAQEMARRPVWMDGFDYAEVVELSLPPLHELQAALTKREACACKQTCGDVPEDQDRPLAICKQLPRHAEVVRQGTGW